MARSVAEKADILPLLAEVFREHGYEGTSLSLITQATGLGKGSLYHFFPGGKEEMMVAVLASIDLWFETEIFQPLQNAASPDVAIDAMFTAVRTYFASGQRVCLVGLLGLSDSRDRFAEAIRRYFARWVEALAIALRHREQTNQAAREHAEQIVAGIQGAIVLARALDAPDVFDRILNEMSSRQTAKSGE
ncbi:TetR/AcrR family transcriptional regulator [Acetobacter orleanensis]|uniref:TetR family transcriptional regulator n=1 Tax=Acetobacter orleanensis TaxID=104099 RepID=A0A4Y3TKA3_9PROT|nr:TetR/AcrR family transcriptional regulator [Acetobacter orleanensis]KXV62764.1 TetR family transcriptional regulator [Acetobacter orleanensis]PCD78315.1 TetR/AcrR family transcriptional regulator [Acetobacter orleanensis]GAN67901.1 transcriptional regulator TetR [Acetobacter orleanensis JCM 7639]GBR24071.1 transcriptional regulator [Acetobacter orleanensis NRIC 0473]GEB83421.1 TetR family transcriptional regulator [Acetobacter orleanensis]